MKIGQTKALNKHFRKFTKLSKNKHQKGELPNFQSPKAQKLKLKIKLMKIPTKNAKLTNYTNFDLFYELLF